MNTVFSSNTSESFVGNEIDDELLGVNMRFHHNRTDEDSDFLQVMEQIQTTSIRYPGGTITEEHFDITDPNSISQINVMHLIHPELIPARTNGVPVTREVTPLSDYLEYVNGLNGEPIIVLPTYRFFDQTTRGLTDNAEADIRSFVGDLMQGEYGSVEKLILEIGNEYYQGRFNWTLEEFGSLQAQIAEWVDDEVSSLGLRDDLTLLAQSGRGLHQSKQLAPFFETDGEPTVDGMIHHFYGTNSDGNPLEMGRNIPAKLEETTDLWSQYLGEDFLIAVTEWNVGEDGANNTVVNGIMRSAPLLFMFAEQVRGGVDISSLWAARTDGPAGLSLRSEAGEELTPTGLFYEMLTESVHGLQLVDPGDNYRLRNEAGEHVGFTYTFEDEDRAVIYFVSGVDEQISLTADISARFNGDAFVYTRTLGAVSGDNGTDYWDDATITQQDDVTITQAGGQDLFAVTLQSYELVELHIIKEPGVTLADDPNSNDADLIFGSDFDDVITANGGRDELFGQDGDDLLEGGDHRDRLHGENGDDEMHGGGGWDWILGRNGDDLIYGGDGNDRLYGGNDDDTLRGENGSDLMWGARGDDLLEGGFGRDRLYGGDGDDRLFGGAGHDILDGGTGDDELTGGRGVDTFVFNSVENGQDEITDFSHRLDKLDMSSFGLETAQDALALARDTSEGVIFDAGGGNSVLLADIELSLLQDDHFIL